MNLIITSVEQGLIFAILAMGMFITYKVLDISDLTVEGTYPLGAFVLARFVTSGMDPLLSTLIAAGAGVLGGLFTALLILKLKIKPLLAGILTMTILYSVCLRVNGKSNIPLSSQASVFDFGKEASTVMMGNRGVSFNILLIMIVFVLVVKLLLDLYLKTESGYLLQATGDNPKLVRALGVNSDKFIVIGLMIANGLIAMSGALMAQYLGFAEITMKNGIIVIALASIIIGDTIKKGSNVIRGTSRAIFGAVVYKIIGGIAIDLGLAPTDLNMINGFIVIVFIAYNNYMNNRAVKKLNERGLEDVKN